MNFNHRL